MLLSSHTVVINEGFSEKQDRMNNSNNNNNNNNDNNNNNNNNNKIVQRSRSLKRNNK